MEQDLLFGKNLKQKEQVKEQGQEVSGPVCPIDPERKVRTGKGGMLYRGGAATSAALSVVL